LRGRSGFARPYICLLIILKAVDVAFDGAGAVGHGEPGGDRGPVPAESERRFVIALQPPPDSPMAASVTRYAMITFCRARHGLQDKLSAGDIAELDALDPALSARDDLTVRTSRTVWLARKPARVTRPR